ncbi:MAG: ABC transporter permease [Candidatus Lambdaproteobacteria bacterium]|nr:ABC transporter permease [Candidatus Lambdaproteobacteria bacterium]
MPRSATFKTSFAFLGVALVCLLFADVEISTLHPWQELGRMARGALTPNFLAFDELGQALLMTLAFGLLGVAAGAVAGFGLSILYVNPLVRWLCAVLRAVHELVWALLFLQFFGLSPLTGLLAIAIPYAGTFGKVYYEIMEEANPAPAHALPRGVGRVSAYFYTRLPDAWVHMVNYSSYRLECGLRSSAVLGFVGLPTLGYHLESFFAQGQYSQAAALLLLFYVVIATLRLWLHARLLAVYLPVAVWAIWAPLDIAWVNVVRFFGVDIVPAPLRHAGTLGGPALAELADWSWTLLVRQALPGVAATVLLTQIALVVTGMVTLTLFPLISRKFFGRFGRTLGHVLLVVLRSTPEYILAYIFLTLWGPSMLPAIVALAVHNGAIIAFLTGRHANEVSLRQDAPRGLNLYGYEIVPRVYGQFLAFLFYRWEIIMRETAILGILGIRTLGFYVDSAFADIRFDRALFLIAITALLNIVVDTFSRGLRAHLRLSHRADIR